MTSKMKMDHTRDIIDHFAKAIWESRKTEDSTRKPQRWVINFRDEQSTNYERNVEEVPINLLRFRKDNGRIASDVLSFEKRFGPLVEDDEEAQKTLGGFLFAKDPEKTDALIKAIKHDGQTEPAIITADGFLINGNRRKLALQKLCEDAKNKDAFRYMRVVILPGYKVPGAPPTLKEIEQIENRYQLRTEAKAEYYKFDRALSIRQKMERGMSLEEQLADDPTYVGLSDKEFQRKVKEYEKDYLRPLKYVDKYLNYLGRQGLYDSVSSGVGDREGRWQAFLDFSDKMEQIKTEKNMIKLGISHKEIGKIEIAAFNIIRKRELTKTRNDHRTGLPKLHMVMRQLPSILEQKDEDKENHAKKAFLKIADIDTKLPKEDSQDDDGNEKPLREIDLRWGEIHASDIIGPLKKAFGVIEHVKDSEKPIALLRTAWAKLSHSDLDDPSGIGNEYCEEAEELARKIRKRADKLESKFLAYAKQFKQYKRKKQK